MSEVIFWYKNHRGEEGYRRVTPIKFYHGCTKWHPDQQLLLLAHDLDKDADRDFAVAGIKDFVGPSDMLIAPSLQLPEAEIQSAPVVSIKPMKLSDNRTDYFVSIRVGDREVTPHVFREEFKAAYHVALYNWLLNGSGEEPDVMAFDENDWPARVIKPGPVDAGVREALIDALAGLKYIEPAIPVLRTMFMTADLALGARKAEEMDASNKEAIKKLEAVLAALSSQPVVGVDQEEIQTTMPKPQQNI